MTADKQPQSLDTAPAPQTTPLYKNARYTKFYLTMLILSTIGTAFGLINLISVPQALSELNTYSTSSIISLVTTFVILPAAIVALVLLWQKKILGLWLKLGTYAATILSVAASFLIIDQIIKLAIEAALKDIAADDGTREFVTAITTSAIYGGMALTVVASIGFGILWWFAWKNQAAADANK